MDAGASVKIIAQKVGGVVLSGGKRLAADEKIDGAPSVLFDAVALVLSTAGTEMLVKESAAVDFVANAFVHLKAIGANVAAKPLLDKARVETDDGITAPG